MRHLKSGRKLNRTAAHRKALIRNLLKALVQREQIQTTDAKAKELRRWADRIVTLGKKDTLHARRLLLCRGAEGDEPRARDHGDEPLCSSEPLRHRAGAGRAGREDDRAQRWIAEGPRRGRLLHRPRDRHHAHDGGEAR